MGRLLSLDKSAGVDIVYTPMQALHRPGLLGALGGWRTSRDDGARIDEMLAALQSAGHVVHAPASHGMEPARRVHTARYLDFLANAYRQW